MRVRARRGPAVLVGLMLAAAGLAGCNGEPAPNPEPTPPTGTHTLTFGVYGNQREIKAYQDVVDTYNQSVDGVEVELESWPTAGRLADAVLDGGTVPDVFLLNRDDLGRATDQELTLPVLELMDERGVDFGDGYSRDALEAFSTDDNLQCMPYHVSPTVLYYNTTLIDFERMERRDLDVPTPDEQSGRYLQWSFDQFQVAARFASRPRQGTKGVHVEPTLSGLAPFVYSAGADVYDDMDEPTSLDLSSDDSRGALTSTLEVLREPSVTLTDKQLARRDAVEWFKRGRLGMLAGRRELLPQLRQAESLRFDVMPMPALDGPATTGELGGMCLSAEGSSKAQAADFLVYLSSQEAVARVTSVGYLVPANLQVAQSDDFLQPSQQPRHGRVFNDAVGSLVVEPLLDDPRRLDRAVANPVEQLFRMPVLDLEAITERIDERSASVLAPEDEETEGTDDTDDPDEDTPDEE